MCVCVCVCVCLCVYYSLSKKTCISNSMRKKPLDTSMLLDVKRDI